MAIRAGNEQRAEKLLGHGANPNAKDSYGFAITQAIREGYEELAIRLLVKGADPHAKDSYGSVIVQHS
jgi:ankyrin repeat protein